MFMNRKTQRVFNRAARALRLAAAALRSSKPALGAYFRRPCAHMDKPTAVTAAHKLAPIRQPRPRGPRVSRTAQTYRHGRF
jgi:transposase